MSSDMKGLDMTMTENSLDQMIDAYITCALWSSVVDEGMPLGDSFTADDLTPDALARIQDDCRTFYIKTSSRYIFDAETPDQMGHDLWLTRNGHGAGFWDRGLGEVGERLSDLARSMGEQSLEVGDDGRIWVN